MKQHTNAERQKFAGVLMSGKISDRAYLRYLKNQYYCYYALENNTKFNLPDDRLKRSEKILEDVRELQHKLYESNRDMADALTESTLKYGSYVDTIKTKEDFMAHVYVRYLGDLRGGQMISKKVPGSGKYYEFDEPEELANSIYSNINDDMVDEAKKVFDFATKLFVEMYSGCYEKIETPTDGYANMSGC